MVEWTVYMHTGFYFTLLWVCHIFSIILKCSIVCERIPRTSDLSNSVWGDCLASVLITSVSLWHIVRSKHLKGKGLFWLMVVANSVHGYLDPVCLEKTSWWRECVERWYASWWLGRNMWRRDLCKDDHHSHVPIAIPPATSPCPKLSTTTTLHSTRWHSARSLYTSWKGD